MTEHRSLVDYLNWACTVNESLSGVVLHHSSISFDLSVTGIYGPLVSGGLVYICALAESEVSSRWLARTPCTFLKGTPSHLPFLAALPDEYSPTGQLMLGGEPLFGEAVEEWRKRHPDSVIVNGYGPSETTINCTQYRIEVGAEIPPGVLTIGRPAWNTQAYVLDSGLELAPLGATGELYVAGPCLARGYWDRPGLTADRFLPDPFGEPGDRMYRTGDLVRWTSRGDLMFAGRVDDQVKVRGHRVELGEIESVLMLDPAVARAVVVLREDRPGDKRLVGYVVPSEEAVDTISLRQHAAAVLPDYMVPAALVTVDSIPLSPNGKVDRRSLPVPVYELVPGRAPRTAQEEILCLLFAEILGLERVGVDDNFFDLGGHSLLATQLVSRVRSALNAELALGALFAAPTAAELAGRLTHARRSRPALVPQCRPREIPLSSAQRRLWFLDRLEGPNPVYNIPLKLRLTGTVDDEALRVALADITARHESLRTVFPERDGRPYQLILDTSAAQPSLTLADTTKIALDEAINAAARYTFTLAAELPIRAWLFRISPDECTLLVLLHHIAEDGWSRSPLSRDLLMAYEARRHGVAPDLPALPVQYADYSLWQRQLLGDEADPGSLVSEQLAFWQKALAGLPEELALPTDRFRAAGTRYSGATVEFALSSERYRALRAFARESMATPFMAIHAGIAALLTRLGGGSDIPLGVPSAGRAEEALDALVGFFVNTLVLRADTSGDPSFRELLGRVREADLAAYAHQDLPFEFLVASLNPARSLGRHPLFQVMLSFESLDSGIATAGLRTAVGDMGVAKFDLTFVLSERREQDGRTGLTGVVEYSTDLFDRGTAETIAECAVRILSGAVAEPDLPIGQIDLLDAADRVRLLREWSGAADPVPVGSDAGVLVPELIRRRARMSPGAVAVICGDLSWSYREL
ncbi:MAG: condensation domain-containing protein, partial [Streptosporangiaceae bacterium]